MRRKRSTAFHPTMHSYGREETSHLSCPKLFWSKTSSRCKALKPLAAPSQSRASARPPALLRGRRHRIYLLARSTSDRDAPEVEYGEDTWCFAVLVSLGLPETAET